MARWPASADRVHDSQQDCLALSVSVWQPWMVVMHPTYSKAVLTHSVIYLD